jgi:hypothetical protein
VLSIQGIAANAQEWGGMLHVFKGKTAMFNIPVGHYMKLKVVHSFNIRLCYTPIADFIALKSCFFLISN